MSDEASDGAFENDIHGLLSAVDICVRIDVGSIWYEEHVTASGSPTVSDHWIRGYYKVCRGCDTTFAGIQMLGVEA
jgi:hypothetical protein